VGIRCQFIDHLRDVQRFFVRLIGTGSQGKGFQPRLLEFGGGSSHGVTGGITGAALPGGDVDDGLDIDRGIPTCLGALSCRIRDCLDFGRLHP
jgi:hypothetical protein